MNSSKAPSNLSVSSSAEATRLSSSMATCDSGTKQQAGTKYLLDTSVASLILDGELWTRYPSALVNHKADVQAKLFHGRKPRTLDGLPAKVKSLSRSINAWKWAELVAPGSIYITPTVQNELTIAPQVSMYRLMCLYFQYSGLGLSKVTSIKLMWPGGYGMGVYLPECLIPGTHVSAGIPSSAHVPPHTPQLQVGRVTRFSGWVGQPCALARA